MTTINYRFQVAGHNAADWTTGNPVLLDREWAVERDTGKIKLGDGSTAWNSLAYFFDPSTFGGGSAAWGSITGTLSAQTDLASALGAKEPSIAAGTTGQYWRGDKSWQTLDKTAVGLGSVDNTADASKAVLSATKLATARTIGMTGDVTWSSGSFDGSGDVTAAATIANGAVTLAKQANVATGTVFYRKTAGTGSPEVQTLDTLKTDLGLDGSTFTPNTAPSFFLPNVAVSNVYYTLWGTSTFSATMSANTLWFMPVVIPYSLSATTMVLNLVSTGVGQEVRLGIYNPRSTSDLRPGTLVLDAGILNLSATTGTRTLTISQSLSPGVYLLAMAIKASTGNVMGLTGAAPLLGFEMTGGAATPVAGYNRSFTYGTLPADETAQTMTNKANTYLLGIK